MASLESFLLIREFELDHLQCMLSMYVQAKDDR